MIKVNSTIKLNMPMLTRLSQAQITALEQTAEELRAEVKQKQVMPFGESIVTEKKVYGKRGQFAKNGREYKGKTVKETIQRGGNLQNDSTFIDNSKSKIGKSTIVSDTPYARRLYFHPEYNFYKGENPNAKGEWYEDYVPGGKYDTFAQSAYKKLYRRIAGL